ncbi:PPA1309 family protein [Corynebacterium pseudopelargi]|uniref:Uncharacterized protein n=1 Tax=Corynebacterium pseudopelargi TaxID=2080757 RepID=A0A3G6IVG8_9CORY|nr:PPA1309 family protein [Corynebacterium pseudopelargi]AZA09789.1 hypothetical protein CPPEL_08430 [Corynebacterium pseudopelargi]
MEIPNYPQQALNKAMLEAVDFIHAEGWDAPPTLFALVPRELIGEDLLEADDAPLALVVQDNLPEHIQPGSEELGEYITRIEWPQGVVGAVLAQEIMFRDASVEGAEPAPARLFSGVISQAASEEGLELTLLQLRPSEEELEAQGAFAEDEVELRGGPGVAPGVIAALQASFAQ